MPTLEEPNLEENIAEQSGYSEPLIHAEPDAQPHPLGIPVPDPPRLRQVLPLDQQQRANDLMTNSHRVGSDSFPSANGGSIRPEGDRDYLRKQNTLAEEEGMIGGLPQQKSGYEDLPNDRPATTSTAPRSTYLKDQADRQLADPRAKIVGGENTGLKGRLLGKNNEKLLSAVENTKAGQLASKATETYDKAKTAINDVKSVGKLLATGGADIGSWLSLAKQHALPLLKKYWRPLVALILIAELPIILIAIAIAVSFGSAGNQAGGVAVASSSLLTAGGGCTSMTDQLVYSKNGKAGALTLSSTKGRWSAEDAAVAPGHLVTESNPKKGNLSFASSNFSTQDLKWYVTSRWPYASWAWSGESRSNKGGPPSGQYAGKKIIIYDTNTKLSAVGIIAESGPAPYTGADHSIVNGEWKEDKAKGSEQKQLWGDQYRSVDPAGYDGNVVGGPKYEGTDKGGSISDGMGAALKAKVGDEMIYGFAKDQSAPLGLSTCTPIANTISAGTTGNSGVTGTDVSNDSAKDIDGTSHFVPNVPAVRQADDRDCNKASAAMVILHYDPKITGFTETVKGHLVNTESSSCYASTSTALEKALGSENIKFDELARSQVSADLFKRSIDAGDPVIIRQTDLISSGVHFVVLVGYDNSHFFFNDPFPWEGGGVDMSLGVEHVYTDRGHNSPHPLITQSALMNALTGSYVAIVRKH